MTPGVEQDIPILTEVVAAAASSLQTLDSATQARLLAQLPELVQATVESLRPQLEQALLDALLPRVLALLETAPAVPPSDVNA